jgi:23S rRNA pseudouridine1911/1915/1917 synthase
MRPEFKIKIFLFMQDELDIVYENQDIIVINKPAGLLVYPIKGEKDTLVARLIAHDPKIKEVGQKERPGIVHRLDRDTSGLMIVAKNNQAYQYLIDQFSQRKITKKYLALVFGKIKEPKGKIVYRIQRGKKMTLDLAGRSAETEYQVVKYFNDFTLVEAVPKTGRMHQIRVHLHKIGHPLVGDKLYRFKRKKFPFPIIRQFLHAYYLKLELPNGKIAEFKIELPQELKSILIKLTEHDKK